MADNNLLQKTYYLDKELDKELINFISKHRNMSELIRKALTTEMKIQNNELILINVKNKEIITSNKNIDANINTNANKEQVQSFITSVYNKVNTK